MQSESAPAWALPGAKAHWKDPRHARALGWADAYGPGPFEVVGVVPARPGQDIPPSRLLGHAERAARDEEEGQRLGAPAPAAGREEQAPAEAGPALARCKEA